MNIKNEAVKNIGNYEKQFVHLNSFSVGVVGFS